MLGISLKAFRSGVPAPSLALFSASVTNVILRLSKLKDEEGLL